MLVLLTGDLQEYEISQAVWSRCWWQGV